MYSANAAYVMGGKMEQRDSAPAGVHRNAGAKTAMAFSYQRPVSKKSVLENTAPVPPFTEIPEELKDWRAPSDRKERILYAALVLLLCILLAVVMIEFSYQMVSNPDALAQAAREAMSAVETFFRSLSGAQ